MQIAMLGPLEVRHQGGTLADVPGARLRAVLIALALRPNQVVPKGSLVDWVWGENPPADAANALQRLMSRLRKALPDAAIEGLTDGYRLTVDPDAVDAVRFERLVSASQAAGQDVSERARLLREAFGLWRGGAMQDVGLQESGAFDAVVVRLEGLRLTAAEERFDAELALGSGAELVTELTDLVAAHPTRERLVAALMRALNAAGRDNEALQLYQRTRETLADELGADPSAELSALHVSLLRGELGGRREQTRKTNLRTELTSFVGRQADLASVRDLVDAQRLTTIIGPGGAGKTRLAVETARTLLGDGALADSGPADSKLSDGELSDGAWLVELAAIGPEGDVAQAALISLGLRDTLLGENPNAGPTDRFVAAMRDRRALIVLDNCEHVIESAAMFAHRVLGECRALRILATSREPLGIDGEHVYRVPSMGTPADGADPETIWASEAVRLLADRAAAQGVPLAGDAAGAAGRGRGAERDRGLPGRAAPAGPRPGGAPGPDADGKPDGRRAAAGDDGPGVPGAGRDAAGDRAGGGAVAHDVRGPARQPPGRPLPAAHRRQPDRAAPAPDAARGGRLELGAAFRRRTHGAAKALGVRRRRRPGGRRAGLRGRGDRAVSGPRAADLADREVAADRRRRGRQRGRQ